MTQERLDFSGGADVEQLPHELRIGSVFSGIGGFELGLEWAGLGPTVWQCERDPWRRSVLRRWWPDAAIYEDVEEIGGLHAETCDLDEDCTCDAERAAWVDVLCGGFPCQDVSSAGRGAGLDGARSGLYFQFVRLVRELRPRYVCVENVGRLPFRGLDRVVGALAEVGYDSVWFCLRGTDLGAPHRRERAFVVAHTDAVGREAEPAPRVHDGGESRDDLDRRGGFPPRRGDARGWEEARRALRPEPGLRRVADGVPGGVDTKRRLRALGDALMPHMAEVVGRVVVRKELERLAGAEEDLW